MAAEKVHARGLQSCISLGVCSAPAFKRNMEVDLLHWVSEIVDSQYTEFNIV